MKPLDPTGLKRLHREWRRQTEAKVAVVLDTIGNPYNVGSIVRMAAAERVDHIYVGGGIGIRHSLVNKTALGTQRYVEWTEFESGLDAAEAARADGYQIVSIELSDQAVPLHEAPISDRVALVVGHEDRGVSAPVLAMSDSVAFIPQLGKVGSLNVAAATAIAIYEARRREWINSS